MPHTKQVSTELQSDALQALEEGQRRFINSTRSLVSKGRESKTLHGRVIYKRLIKEYARVIKKQIDKIKKGRASRYTHIYALLVNINPTIIAHFTLNTLIDPLSRPCLRNSLANKIGVQLQDEINFRGIKDKYPGLWKRFRKAANLRVSYHYKRSVIVKAANEELGNSWKTDWGAASRIHVGLTLIELLRISTGIVEYDKRKLGRRYSYYILPSLQILAWIKDFNDTASALTPYLLPCEEPPVSWTSLHSGGYEFPKEVNWCFVKTKNKSLDYLKEADLGLVFSAANSLQSVPHRVNSRVLGLLTEAQKAGSNLGKNILQVPSAGASSGDNYKDVSKPCQAQMHRDRIAEMPHFIRTYNLMGLANKFKDKKIYFPVQADFRGRLYYANSSLNPQGCDMAKGLIQFDHAVSVKGAEDWFLVGGANNFGIKGTNDHKQSWVLKHEKEILKVAADPLACRAFWEDCSNPLVFVAWAFEFKDWMRNRLSFKTRLPVRLDHTASGLQIVSLLTNDKELQRLTNLADNKEPSDVYEILLDNMKQLLITSGRPENHTWVSLGVDRKLVKNITVAYMYGGSTFGLERAVVSWYIDKRNDIFKENVYKEITVLLEYYHKALKLVSPAPQKFIDECRESQKDELLSWTSASGFPVQNLYNPQASVRIRTTVGGAVVSGRANIPDTSKISVRASRNAIAANIVHSHDAALMHRVIAKNNWQAIQTLHDCYCISPNDCRAFVKILPSEIKCIYGVDMPERLLYAAS